MANQTPQPLYPPGGSRPGKPGRARGATPPASFSDPLADTDTAKPARQAAKPRRYYRVERVAAGGLGVVLLGHGVINESKIADRLNSMAAQGWTLDFATVTIERLLFFWPRERVLLYFVVER